MTKATRIIPPSSFNFSGPALRNIDLGRSRYPMPVKNCRERTDDSDHRKTLSHGPGQAPAVTSELGAIDAGHPGQPDCVGTCARGKADQDPDAPACFSSTSTGGGSQSVRYTTQ